MTWGQIRGSLVTGFQIENIQAPHYHLHLNRIEGKLQLLSSLPHLTLAISDFTLPPALLSNFNPPTLPTPQTISKQLPLFQPSNGLSLSFKLFDLPHTLQLMPPTVSANTLQGTFKINQTSLAFQAHTHHTPHGTNLTLQASNAETKIAMHLAHTNTQSNLSAHYHDHALNTLSLSAHVSNGAFQISDFQGHIETLHTPNFHFKKIDFQGHTHQKNTLSPLFKLQGQYAQIGHTVLKNPKLDFQYTGRSSLSSPPLSLHAACNIDELEQHLQWNITGDLTNQTIHLKGFQYKPTPTAPHATPLYDFQVTQSIHTQNNQTKLLYTQPLLNQTRLFSSSNDSKSLTLSLDGLHIDPIQSNTAPALDLSGHISSLYHYQLNIIAKQLNIHHLFTNKWIHTGPLHIQKAEISGEALLSRISQTRPIETRNHFSIDTFEGDVHLREIISNAPYTAPLKLTQQNLHANITPTHLSIYGEVLSKEKSTINISFQLNHQASWDTPLVPFDLKLNGKNITLLSDNTSHIHADVELSCIATDHTLNTQGQITFHNTHYNHQAPWMNHLQLPSETIILKKSDKPAPIIPPSPILHSYDITLSTDKDNTINIFDIQANVEGTVRFHAENSNEPLASGHVYLNSASLNFFNSLVPIEKLQLHWHNHPIINPELDAELKRSLHIPSQSKQQTYGLRISGPISKPILDFYSNPMQMTQYEILASLLSPTSRQSSQYTPNLSSNKLFSLIDDENIDKKSLANSLKSLSAIKKIFIFEYIGLEDHYAKNGTNAFLQDLELTLTRKLRDNVTLQLKLTPDSPDKNKLLIDTHLNKHVSVSTYVSSKGSGGVAAHFRK